MLAVTSQNRTVANLSMLPDAAVEALRLALKGEVLAPPRRQLHFPPNDNYFSPSLS
jgi:hypothetical protein